MKVEAPSSARTTAMTFDIQATPNSRSSRTKRARQRATCATSSAWLRNLRHCAMTTPWMANTPSIQTPASTIPVHMPPKAPTQATSSTMAIEAERRFCANWRKS